MSTGIAMGCAGSSLSSSSIVGGVSSPGVTSGWSSLPVVGEVISSSLWSVCVWSVCGVCEGVRLLHICDKKKVSRSEQTVQNSILHTILFS